jgi:predicted nucleic acid-binding protein
MVNRFHLDTDFLVKALLTRGPERTALQALADSVDEIEMSAIAWYEFCRGPRRPEQVAVARNLLENDGIVPFTENHAEMAAEMFLKLGRPRKRSADLAIAAVALARGARLLTGNTRDYSGIDGLELGLPLG